MGGAKTDSGHVPLLTARAQAAMLSAACGDALGWPVEPRGHRVGGTAKLAPRLSFMEWTRREGGGYAPFQRRIPAGTYSDDTQLMLAVARSLSQGESWWEHLTRFELPAWTLYELGGGGAIKRAANGWARGQAPWEAKKTADRKKYFAAGANGVAMRILPHAIFGADDPNFDRVGERIVADGLTTHGHPRALVGALVAGYAMWTGLRWRGKIHYGELIEDCLGEKQSWTRLPEAALAPDWKQSAEHGFEAPYEVIWTQVGEEMVALLMLCQDAIKRGSLARDSDVLDDLGAFGKEGGSGTRTAAAAIYLASRYVAKPTAGLLAAAFARRADTDTIACLTGAMLGAFTGDSRVDGLAAGLQDAGYICDVAGQVARREVEHRPLVTWSPRMKSRILGELAQLEPKQAISLPLFGEGCVEMTEHPTTKSANDVRIWWLSTQLGQTLAVTSIKKAQAQRTSNHSVTPDRAAQMTMDEGPRDRAGVFQSTWNFIFVRDLSKALVLYHDILDIPVRRIRDGTAVLAGNLVLEESDQKETSNREDLRAPEVIGVFVMPQALDSLHRRIADSGYEASDIGPGRHGERFRLRDNDGHIVEVCTSPPSQ